MDAEELPTLPPNVVEGKLENGLRYYVCSGSMVEAEKTSLALVLKIGSVVEEEDERGVAHIVEHLCFSRENYKFVKSLRDAGVLLGQCQNGATSLDNTQYTTLVPTNLLPDTLSLIANGISERKVSVSDLDNERDVVLDEYRKYNMGGQARLESARLKLILQGSKYGERRPIGLQEVIRQVSPEAVENFIRKWYRFENMAIVAVGDFCDNETIVELINTKFGAKFIEDDPIALPEVTIPFHLEPRYLCFGDSEVNQPFVYVSFLLPVVEVKTVKDFRSATVEDIFYSLFTLRCRNACEGIIKDVSYRYIPFVGGAKLLQFHALCDMYKHTDALEGILMEMARVRMYGFSADEVKFAQSAMWERLATLDTVIDSKARQNELVEHFLRNSTVLGKEDYIRYMKEILPDISVEEVSSVAMKIRTSSSCCFMTVEKELSLSVSDLEKVVRDVNSLEENRSIQDWEFEEEDSLEEECVIDLANEPSLGVIENHVFFSEIGVEEYQLSNGMTIAYKYTDNDELCRFFGISYGGLSEVPKEDYYSCKASSSIAESCGLFGNNTVNVERLKERSTDVMVGVEHYIRSFSGNCMARDFEKSLQLVYQLFTTDVVYDEATASKTLDALKNDLCGTNSEQGIKARLNAKLYEGTVFHKPYTLEELSKVDAKKGCEFFNNCFRDPSTFYVVIVANVRIEEALRHILLYLGGIQRSPVLFNSKRAEVKCLPLSFCGGITRETHWFCNREASCEVVLNIPATFARGDLKAVHIFQIMVHLLYLKLEDVLRYDLGKTYEVTTHVIMQEEHPTSSKRHRVLRVAFCCDPFDPSLADKLLDRVLEVISNLQMEGPTDEEFRTLSLVERNIDAEHEYVKKDNKYWLYCIVNRYRNPLFIDDLDAPYLDDDKACSEVVNTLDVETLKTALQCIFPNPVRDNYAAYIIRSGRE